VSLAGLFAGLAEEGCQRRDVYQRLVRPDGDRQGTFGELRRAPRREVRAESKSGVSPACHRRALLHRGGREENEGFHIQNRLIGEKWDKVRETDIPCPGKNHFTVLEQVCDPESGLFKSMLEMMDV